MNGGGPNIGFKKGRCCLGGSGGGGDGDVAIYPECLLPGSSVGEELEGDGRMIENVEE